MPSSRKPPPITDRLRAIDFLLREGSRHNDRQEAGLLQQIKSVASGRVWNLSLTNLNKLLEKAMRFGLDTKGKK